MDVLAQVTSVLPVRHRVAKLRCGKFVAWTGFGYHRTRARTENKKADQVANVVTLMTDRDC